MDGEWAPPKFARKITGYKSRQFYNLLKEKDANGNPIIPHKLIDIPGRPVMYNVWLPGLIPFMQRDIPRLRKEANNWTSHYKHQEESLKELQRRFPNA